jgi:hypothetical protein
MVTLNITLPTAEYFYLCTIGGDFHFIEKAIGIKHLYAWLDRYPDVHPVVANLLSLEP